MKFYSVMRFGNDNEGPDGEDTEFVVLSDSVPNAASIVDIELSKLSHQTVDPFCHAVAIIGESFSSHDKSLILSGPTLVNSSRFGIGIPEKNIWRRENDTLDSEWVLLEDY